MLGMFSLAKPSAVRRAPGLVLFFRESFINRSNYFRCLCCGGCLLPRIDLRPDQESLRKLISRDDPGDWLLFPCMITGLLFERKHIANFVIPPMRTRFEARRVWLFAITGFLFHFFVSNRLPPDRIRGAFLQHDGTFHVPVADIGEIPSVQFWMKQMAAAEKTRSANRTTY